jgi:hypothetical protein
MLAPKTGKLIRKDLKRFAMNTRDKFASAIDKGKVIYLEGKKKPWQQARKRTLMRNRNFGMLYSCA